MTAFRLALSALCSTMLACSAVAQTPPAVPPISPHCQKMMMIGCALTKNSKGRNAPAAAKECADLLKEGECKSPAAAMPQKIVKVDAPKDEKTQTDETEKPKGSSAASKSSSEEPDVLSEDKKPEPESESPDVADADLSAPSETADTDIAKPTLKAPKEPSKSETAAALSKALLSKSESSPDDILATGALSTPDSADAADEALKHDLVTVPPKDLIEKAVIEREAAEQAAENAAASEAANPDAAKLMDNAVGEAELSTPTEKEPTEKEPAKKDPAAKVDDKTASATEPETPPSENAATKPDESAAPKMPDSTQTVSAPPKKLEPVASTTVPDAPSIAAEPQPKTVELTPVAPTTPAAAESTPPAAIPAAAHSDTGLPPVALPAAVPAAPSTADAASIQDAAAEPMSITFANNTIIPDQANKVTFFLRRGDNNSPVTFQDLKEVHTQKLHLLIIDPALKEYHHVHPVEGSQAGEYTFTFTPTGSYFRVFADVTTIGGDKNLYVKGVLGVKPVEKSVIDTVTRYESSDGSTVSAVLSFGANLKAGTAVLGTIRLVDSMGTPIKNLEPVMGSFGHIVAFSQDLSHVIHVHPMGMQPISDNDRGGPELQFHFEPETPGFVRLYVQVKLGGKDIFIPFGFTVP